MFLLSNGFGAGWRSPTWILNFILYITFLFGHLFYKDSPLYYRIKKKSNRPSNNLFAGTIAKCFYRGDFSLSFSHFFFPVERLKTKELAHIFKGLDL